MTTLNFTPDEINYVESIPDNASFLNNDVSINTNFFIADKTYNSFSDYYPFANDNSTDTSFLNNTDEVQAIVDLFSLQEHIKRCRELLKFRHNRLQNYLAKENLNQRETFIIQQYMRDIVNIYNMFTI
jgi:hypothetical protein